MIVPVPPLTPRPPGNEDEKARKRRNLWLGLSLAAFVVIVIAATIIRLSTGDGVSRRM
jgi:hypothetical protein